MEMSLQRLLTLVAALALSGPALAAHDHDSHLFSAFLSSEVDFSSTKPGEKDTELDAVADVILSHQSGRWRMLGELVLSPDEHEFERLQLGYEVADNAIVWIGRFHQPSSVWNVFYHHGQFLQTSVTRPAMEEWEDEDGFLPQHVVGGLFESLIPSAGDDAWRISVAAGLAPRAEARRLRPFVPFRDDTPGLDHVSARLEWLPDALGEDVVGFVVSRTRMRSIRPLATVPLTVKMAGVFTNIGAGRLRALGNLSFIDTQGTTTGTASTLRFRNHVAAYIQLEAEASDKVTLFARQEVLTNVRNSAYLADLSPPPARRMLAGARLQLGLRNALSFEASRSRLPGTTHKELRLQWSAALP